MRRSLLSVVLIMSVLAPALILSGPSASAAKPPVKCQKVAKPIVDENDVNKMNFRFCTGKVKSKDGTAKLDTSVTMPATGKGPFPLIVMLHGLTGSRKSNESDFVVGKDSNYHYNNLWFASKGYMVLSFTARGWNIFKSTYPYEEISRSPCVNLTPQSVDGKPASMYPQADPACYIQISHLKYDVADTQYLVGRLVDGTLTDADGVEAAPRKVGVTGISLGAGQTWLLTRKNEWKSPKGTLIRIAGAAPIIGWTDIVDALAPNGRRTDTETSLSMAAREAEPAGVKNDYVDVFYTAVGSFSTGGYGVTTSYLKKWKDEFDAGEPYIGNTFVADAIHKLLKNRSAWYVNKTTDFDTPIFAVQGMTDGIFWAGQSLRMYNRLNAEREAAGKARYPMRLYLGDWGHSPSQNKQAEFQYFVDELNNWFRYHVKGNGNKPLNTIEARMTVCNGSDGALGPLYRNGNWSLLSGGGLVTPVVTTGTPTLHTPADDPHELKLVPADGNRGNQFNETHPDSQCRETDTDFDTDNAQWTSDPIAGDPIKLLGMPEVTVTVNPDLNEMYVAGRLWDVDYGADAGPDDDTQTLVTRGVYRIEGGDEGEIILEMFGNAYEFDTGHSIKLELTADDSPSWQQWKGQPTGDIGLSGVSFSMPTARCIDLLPECP